MSFRVFKGNVLSAQGWRMCNADECEWVYIPGTNNSVSIQVRSGIPAVILPAFLARFNQLVEKLRDADTACWTLNNDVDTSNHPAGIATDANWGLHPFHAKGTFGDRLPILRQVLNEFRGCVDWGGDWRSPIDEMHFELAHPEGYLDRNGNFVLAVDQRLIELANDLRAGYLNIYVPGVTPTPSSNSAEVLAKATGLTLNRATEILPTMVDGLKQADCTNVNRSAMFIAQTGHEAANFEATEEYASGAAYEGRADLGNTQPGDGVRFKGRTWIQITGRHNYGKFSEWAFGKGLVPTPTYFVDNPTELSDLKWAGTGAAWYWTVARGTRINEASDQRDLVTVTQLINGGQNGIEDRRTRYNRALALGDQLLALTTGGDDFLMALSADEQQRMLARTDQIWGALFNEVQSESPYAKDGGDPIKTKDFLRFVDASTHALSVEAGARYGDPTNVAQIASAAARGNSRARLVLADLEANYPSALQNYLALKGARQ